MAGDDKTGNKSEEMKGKAKEAVGRVSGNDELETEGKSEQRKSKLKQAGKHAKDAFKG